MCKIRIFKGLEIYCGSTLHFNLYMKNKNTKINTYYVFL